MISRRLNRRTVIRAATVLILAVALIGWMHTPGARPILRKLGVPCPVENVSAEQVSAMHEKGLAGMRGQSVAPIRPAMGMLLDGTTELEAKAWAIKNSVNCETILHGYRFLRCRGVPANTLNAIGPAVSELWLSFGPSGKLIGVDVYRRGLDAQGAVTVWSSATGKLKNVLGEPEIKFGDASPSTLMASTLRTARVQYRYADYIATITAINLPHAGLAVREQYLSGNTPLGMTQQISMK